MRATTVPGTARGIFVARGFLFMWFAGGGLVVGQTLPHRTYALRGYSARDRHQEALVNLRDRLIAALQASSAMPPGYPQPCRFTFDPPQRPGVVSRVKPAVTARTDPEANGILLDAEGHYVMLGVVDFPDARFHLIEVFLVPDSAGAVLRQADRNALPRVVIGHPVLGENQYPTLIDALRLGLRNAGADEVTFK